MTPADDPELAAAWAAVVAAQDALRAADAAEDAAKAAYDAAEAVKDACFDRWHEAYRALNEASAAYDALLEARR